MPIIVTRETDAAGVRSIHVVDADTSELLEWRRLEDGDQTPKVRMESFLRQSYEDWQRWKATREEAQFRGAAANIITALTNRENNAWSAYVAAINEWRLM